MSSHFANEKYFLLNRDLGAQYFNENHKVRFYQNASLALFDIATSLQQFMAHKSHFAVAKNGSSLIEALSPIWIRNVNPLQVKADAQNWLEFIETLHADTNFVIWASENEITGEVLVDAERAQEIHQMLSHKRIYSIQICHHQDKSEKIFPYSIQILRAPIFSEKPSIVVHADRFKAGTHIGNFQNLDFTPADIESFLLKDNDQDSQLLTDFEARLTHEKQAYFNRFVSTTLRLKDRVVLNYGLVNAFALQQELQLPDAQCLAPSKYPFWILQSWKNWWKEAENETLLRGLLVISVHALRQNPDLVLKLNQVSEEFKRLGHIHNI